MRERSVPNRSLRRYVIALLVVVAACGGGGADPVVPPGPPGSNPPPSTPGPVASVSVAATVNSVPVGETLQLTATLRDASNQVLSGRTIAWISSNPALATVASTGLVIGHYAGTVTVRATSEGVTGTAEIAVTVPAKPSVVANYSLLDSTQAAFLRFAAQTNGDPARALGMVAQVAAADPRVAKVDLIDSTYLQMQLKSGMVNVLRYTEVNAQGRSSFRGGGHAGLSGYSGLSKFGSASTVITNKKVLICSPDHSEFYGTGDIEKIVNRFESAGVGFQVTLLKDKQCNYRVFSTFANYGLVIIDAHGMPNGILTGETVGITQADRATEATAKAALDARLGDGTYDKIVSGDLAVARDVTVLLGVPNSEWWKTSLSIRDELWATSQFVRTLRMPDTIVFGNMCYSGFISHPTRPEPLLGGYIQPAFRSTGVRAYYGYTLLDGSSLKVTNEFAKEMEDSLTYALVVDGDSTGIAHRASNTTLFMDQPFRGQALRFTQYGATGYGYYRLAIAPDTTVGQLSVPIAFTADHFGTAPTHALYKWDFGDGTPVVSVTDNQNVVHTYLPKVGGASIPLPPFNVSVTLYNNADAAHPSKIAVDTAKARMLEPFAVQPATVGADPGQNVILTARPGGRAPVGAKYRWNFGDGSPVVTQVSDSVGRHVFANVGSYRVTVELIEPSQNKTLATATAEVSTELKWTITSMTVPVTVGPAATLAGVNHYIYITDQLNLIRADPGHMTLAIAPSAFGAVTPTMATISGNAVTGPNQFQSVLLYLGSSLPVACSTEPILSNTGGGSTGTVVGHFVQYCEAPYPPLGQTTTMVLPTSWSDFTASKLGTTLSGTLRFTIRDYSYETPYRLENYHLLGERQVTVSFTAERLVRAAGSR